jgi:hypothetical protein
VGSSGEKRKGRHHLPKVGTPADMEWERHERIEEALHPFSDDPGRRRGRTATVVTVIVAVVVVLLVILGLLVLT